MNIYLAIDFGSTYTKLTAIDLDGELILATAKSITTVEDNIMNGFYTAFEKLKLELSKKIHLDKIKFVNKTACSSAAGGLKMITIGLVPEMTSEAAKKTALGAGARVIKTYSYGLSKEDIDEIKNTDVDIILLTGGTNGGNKECIIENAKIIGKHRIKTPIIVAGNDDAKKEIGDILKKYNINYYLSENVMPSINKLNVEPSREEIRKIFMDRIVKARGLNTVEEFIEGILMPTPTAVLKAARTLSVGTKTEAGIGDLIVVDIGGATTDIHSISKGEPSNSNISLKGLEEPFAKRTVEGDLGMRYSALALLEASGADKIRTYLGDLSKNTDIEFQCKFRHNNIKFIPKSIDELEFDEALAMVSTEIAMTRHCGKLEKIYTTTGTAYAQVGKDLLKTPYVIGTGGVIIHSKAPNKILKSGNFKNDNPLSLKPKDPIFLIDNSYILSAMGLLSEDYPDIAIRIMKKYLIKI